jgi:hypothetical protein
MTSPTIQPVEDRLTQLEERFREFAEKRVVEWDPLKPHPWWDPAPWDPVPPWLDLSDVEMRRRLGELEIQFKIKELQIKQEKLEQMSKMIR